MPMNKVLVLAGMVTITAWSAEITVTNSTALVTLLGSTARPGDVIRVAAGTYWGPFRATVSGTALNPIRVMAMTGERATLTSTSTVLSVTGSHLWFYGLEVTSAGTDRSSDDADTSWPTDITIANGVEATAGEGIKFINCVVHDTRQDFGLWKDARTEVYGCIIYHSGWWAVKRGHGHGTYTQNELPLKLYRHNVWFGGFSMGVQAYGSSAAPLKNFHFVENVFVDNGWLQNRAEKNLLLGGTQSVYDSRIASNHMYYRPGSTGCNLNIGFWPYGGPYTNVEVCGNRIIGGRLSFSGNGKVNYHDNWTADVALMNAPTGAVNSPRPTVGLESFLIPNDYDPSRSLLVVYNWSRAAEVVVSVGSHRNYEVRDAMNYYAAPVAVGDAAFVRIKMSSLQAAQPVGDAIPFAYAHTAPEFGVFVVQSRGTARPSRPKLNLLERSQLNREAAGLDTKGLLLSGHAGIAQR